MTLEKKTRTRPDLDLELRLSPEVNPPRDLVQDDERGHYRKARSRFLHFNWTRGRDRLPIQARILGWLRDHVNKNIPKMFYRLMLGHDIHLTTFAELFVRHFHYNEPDPFVGRVVMHSIDGRGRVPGWWENVGMVSSNDVTNDFRDFEIACLISDDTEYGDFKFHRVGDDNTAESNSHSALQNDAGLECSTGSQVQGASADIYKSVGTIQADAQETWEEHGLFSQTAAAGTMMDRNLISPNVSVEPNDTVEFTYELTKTSES